MYAERQENASYERVETYLAGRQRCGVEPVMPDREFSLLLGSRGLRQASWRPFVGSSWICTVSITWLISVLVGSTGGASVVTVTTSTAEATWRMTSMVTVWPTLSETV